MQWYFLLLAMELAAAEQLKFQQKLCALKARTV
jgi:hypothetical protein